MSQRVSSSLQKVAAWQKNVSWSAVLIEGLVALAFGLFCVIWVQQARFIFLLVLSCYLLMTGCIALVVTFTSPQDGVSPRWPTIVLGVVAAGIGLFGVSEIIFKFAGDDAVRIVIGIGFLITGLIGLYKVYTASQGKLSWEGGLISSLLYIALAILLFFLTSTNTILMTWIGWILVIGGLLLTAYALLTRGLNKSSRTPVTS